MKWPWTKREPPTRPDDNGIDEAHQALEASLDLWPEVHEVTAQIRGIRRRNHLAEITERALRGSR